MKIPVSVNNEPEPQPHGPTDEELQRAVSELIRAGVYNPKAPWREPGWMGDY